MLVPGVVALLDPLLHDVRWSTGDRTGIPIGLLAPLAITVPCSTEWQVLGRIRHQFDTRLLAARLDDIDHCHRGLCVVEFSIPTLLAA